MEAKKRAVAALVVKPAAQISNGPAKESTKVDSLQPVSVLCNQLKSLAPQECSFATFSLQIPVLLAVESDLTQNGIYETYSESMPGPDGPG